LICGIFGNNTLVDTNTVENTTTTTVITSALDALNQTLNQSLTQLLNQSSIPLQPFGDNDFNDMLNNDSGSFNEQDDLDSEMDEWIDRMLNATLGDLQAPLQTSPDLLAISV
jgi:Cdc6-like AAA superfamily ATPase